MNDISNLLFLVLLGAIGGFSRGIFTGFRPPRIIKLGDGSMLYDLGWIGDVVVGGISSFIIRATGLGNPDPPAVYGVAIISGIIGSAILRSYTDYRANKYIIQILSDAIEKKIVDTDREKDI